MISSTSLHLPTIFSSFSFSSTFLSSTRESKVRLVTIYSSDQCIFKNIKITFFPVGFRWHSEQFYNSQFVLNSSNKKEIRMPLVKSNLRVASKNESPRLSKKKLRHSKCDCLLDKVIKEAQKARCVFWPILKNVVLFYNMHFYSTRS